MRGRSECEEEGGWEPGLNFLEYSWRWGRGSQRKRAGIKS